MTGPEHYSEAERLLANAKVFREDALKADCKVAAKWARWAADQAASMANTHALLAVAASQLRSLATAQAEADAG